MGLELREPEGLNLAGEQTGRSHLSHSGIGVMNACLQKWDFSYEQRLEPIQRKRALSLGGAFAEGREHRDPSVAAAALQREYDESPGLDHERFLTETATVLGALGAYMTRWPAAPQETGEVEYLVQLRNPWTGAYSRTFDLLGRADGVVDHGDFLELIEDKLVGRVDDFKVRHLPLDRQIQLARYGLWRATGKPVRVVSYRWTKKPSIRQKKDETVDQFCDRLVEDYAGRVEFYTHEERLFTGAEDLLRIEQELWIWADTLRTARRRALFPRNTAACSDFGGCQFIDLCMGDPDARSLYREREPYIRPNQEGTA